MLTNVVQYGDWIFFVFWFGHKWYYTRDSSANLYDEAIMLFLFSIKQTTSSRNAIDIAQNW